LFSYSAFVSKLMPDTGILVLDFMKHDYYFCYLFPLMLLPTYIVVYINWLAMKFFKNN
jgi:Phosphatidylinositol N-acetylglucosaminyltransferase subunit Y